MELVCDCSLTQFETPILPGMITEFNSYEPRDDKAVLAKVAEAYRSDDRLQVCYTHGGSCDTSGTYDLVILLDDIALPWPSLVTDFRDMGSNFEVDFSIDGSLLGEVKF